MSEQTKKYNLPDGYSIFKTAFKSKAFLDNPIQFMGDTIEKFGDTYTATLGFGRKIIITQNATFINHVLKENHKNYNKSRLTSDNAATFFGKGLLFSNGDYWLKQRRLIQPAFHREKIQGLYEIVNKSITQFLQQIPTGDAIDVYPLTHQMAFNIIIQSLFDIDLAPSMMQEISQILIELQDFVFKDVNQPFRKILYPITREKSKSLAKAKRLRVIFLEIIEQRKKEGKAYADLLDMLLNSRYEDTGEAMTNDQIIDEVLILIFAGHETSANALAWILYLISENKSAYEKLMTSMDGKTIYDSLQNEYLKATINEGMRLYPPAWMTDRVALSDDAFGAYAYAKGTIIISFFFGMHHDKKNWKDPMTFVPERFLDDPSLAKSKSFFPFGAGPRMCIGNNFAIMEMCFFLHSFLQTFDIEKTGQVPILKPLITLRPDKVILKISRKG